MPYTPKQGDIVVLDFSPQAGHEQKGRRPGLIVSNDRFYKRTGLAMICPITSTISNFPTHILLDGKTKTTGEVMCEQVKCLDISARNVVYTESASDKVIEEAIDLVCAFVE